MIIKYLLIFALIYLSIAMIIYLNQKRFMFFPSKKYYPPPENLGIEEVSFQTSDGITLHAWWMSRENAKKTVLYFHGNGNNIYSRDFQMETFKELNFNALMFDYRGYGKSEGEIRHEEDLYLDSNAAWNFLIKKGIPEKDIILWAHSLGGGILTEIAQEKQIYAVILESTFYSMKDMARKKFWFIPTKFFISFHFDSGEKIKNIQVPVIVTHSKDDRLIPFSQGRKLFEAANEPKLFIEMTGDHNTGVLNSKMFLKEVEPFLESANSE